MNKLKVLIRHLWLDVSDTRRVITPDIRQRLTERVAASERRHSGQIRICVEASLPSSYLWRLNSKNSLRSLIRARALMMFGKLQVWDTERNNGVLIYMLLAEHTIELVADRGLMQHISPEQWRAMVARMSNAFKDKRYESGITQALEEVSAILIEHFALTNEAKNRNELPDTLLQQ